MTDLKSPAESSLTDDWIEMRIVAQNRIEDGIDTEVLGESLNSVSKVIQLLTGAFRNEPNEELPRTNSLRDQFKSSYTLRSKETRLGSYVIPIQLGLKEPVEQFKVSEVIEEISKLKQFIFDFFAAAVVADETKLEKHCPRTSNLHRLLEAVSNLIPATGHTVQLQLLGADSQPFFDSDRDSRNIKELSQKIGKPTKPATELEETTVVGEIVEIDLRDQTCQIQTPDGFTIAGDLTSNSPPSEELFKATPIEVSGTFEIDEDGLICGIVSQESKRLVNLDPIKVETFPFHNELLRATPPLIYEVDLMKEDGCYSIDGDLDLFVYAYSREELEDVVIESLQSFWELYVIADDSELAPSGVQKKREIMNRIQQI